MAFTGSYIAPVEIRNTGTPAAGTTIWIMRGPPTLFAYVRRIRLALGFDGTAATGTQRIGIYTGTGAATATGGAAITPAKKSQSFPPSSLQDVRQDSAAGALTTTGITFPTDPLLVLGVPISVTSHTQRYEIPFGVRGDTDDSIKLGPNDHLAIRIQTVAGVIGFSCVGGIEFDEA